MRSADLVPHPATPCTAVRSITVEIEQRDVLRLRYRIRGRINELVLSSTAHALPAAEDPVGARHARDRRGHGPLPQNSPAVRRDGLWRHSCCEVFLADTEGPGYREFNFAPCGDWAAYRFDDYRAGMREPCCTAPRIETQSAAAEWVLEATLAEPGPHGAIGLCCVIEERDGRLSFWALAHTGERPDFHHRGGFLLAASTTP